MTEKTYLQTFVFVWIFIGLGSLLTYGVSRALTDFEAGRMALNFFLGGVVSVMLMSHNYKTTMRTAKENPEALRRRAMGNYFFRYAFYALILAVVLLRSPSWQYLIPVFVGFTAFKVTMFTNFMIRKVNKSQEEEDTDGD